MKIFDVPAHITSAAGDNITDLLALRAKNTPNLPLFAVEHPEGNWLMCQPKRLSNRFAN